jgi:outer membrane lipopolysaccharide assembly protein LptE/RlpB
MKKLLPAALAALILALTACGGTVIDTTKAEDTLASTREQETGEKVKEVDCPSDVEVKVGDTFECNIIETEGKRSTATLKIRTEDADLDLVSVKPSGQ